MWEGNYPLKATFRQETGIELQRLGPIFPSTAMITNYFTQTADTSLLLSTPMTSHTYTIAYDILISQMIL